MPFLNKSTLTYPATNAFPNGIWEDTRDPLSSDFKNFTIGNIWINYINKTAWILVDKTVSQGTWIKMAVTATGILDITGNVGGPVGPDIFNNINLVATGDLTVTGNPGTNTLTISQNGTVATSYAEDIGVATPAAGILNIVGGAGISTTGAGNTFTITNTSASGATWFFIPGISQTMTPNTYYAATNVALTTITLPLLAAQGTVLAALATTAGGWTIAQNGGQNIQLGFLSSTPGVGSISSTSIGDLIYLVCTVANTTWFATGSMGNLIIT